MRWILLVSLFAWSLTGAAQTLRELAINYDIIEKPHPGAFSVCAQHGCQHVANTRFTPAEWARVRALFTPAADKPETERKQIARAIGLIERLVGPKVNTADDRAGNLAGISAHGNQQDCVDESVNTTTYLSMLANDHLLKHHTVDSTESRGFVIFGWPHNTAVIKENRGPRRWAVDSWFRDNGADADMVPLKSWKSGWKPEGFAGF